MSDALTINIKKSDDTASVQLSGRIDEDAHFEAILQISSARIIFDFDHVTLINSCGVREWINLISSLISKSKIIYQNCPQILVEQMNMVQGFLPPGTSIESFYAPYFDPKLDKEVKILINTNEIHEFKAPIKKSEQGNELEFDALEAQYFNFLK